MLEQRVFISSLQMFLNKAISNLQMFPYITLKSQIFFEFTKTTITCIIFL